MAAVKGGSEGLSRREGAARPALAAACEYRTVGVHRRHRQGIVGVG